MCSRIFVCAYMTTVDQGVRNPTSVTGGNAGGDQIVR